MCVRDREKEREREMERKGVCVGSLNRTPRAGTALVPHAMVPEGSPGVTEQAHLWSGVPALATRPTALLAASLSQTDKAVNQLDHFGPKLIKSRMASGPFAHEQARLWSRTRWYQKVPRG